MESERENFYHTQKLTLIKKVSSETKPSTPANSDTGSVLEVDMNKNSKTTKVSLNFPFCPQKKVPGSDYTGFMTDAKPKFFVQQRNFFLTIQKKNNFSIPILTQNFQSTKE